MQGAPKLLELRPNRALLNSNFEGYKLSLTEISTFTRQLNNPVDHVAPGPNQYSLLHAKLYGFQNHLVGESIGDEEAVFFIDTSWNLQKFKVDSDLTTVWQLPQQRDRQPGDYNISMKLVNPELAVVADGAGFLYVLERGLTWNVIFSGEIAGPNQNFVIKDAVITGNEINLLLLSIRQKPQNERFCTILHWITLQKSDCWNEVALRELTVNGFVQFVNFEKNCKAVYVISDSGCKFTLDSENEIKNEPTSQAEVKYTWTETSDDITLKIPLPGNMDKSLISVKNQVDRIEVKYDEDVQLEGSLYQRIDPDLTCWVLANNTLQIVLQKADPGLRWPEFIPGDEFGQYIPDPGLVAEAAERLAPLTSEQEETPPTGTTFNSQQVEECDFTLDKITVFERIEKDSHKVSHKVNLGSHQVLLTVRWEGEVNLGFGVRSDVDTCLWLPKAEDEFSLEHKGTLLAMGYIQASKQQMKYFVCSPDLSYSAICESTQHIFIYCQKKPITHSNELRNRTTGQRIATLAQQLVYKLPSNIEIVGFYASNTHLYILGENFVSALKI